MPTSARESLLLVGQLADVSTEGLSIFRKDSIAVSNQPDKDNEYDSNPDRNGESSMLHIAKQQSGEKNQHCRPLFSIYPTVHCFLPFSPAAEA